MKRRVEAAAFPLTDAVGLQTNKARSLSAWLRQAIRAVVSLPNKPTGVSVDSTRAGLHSNTSGLVDTSKQANSLSSRSPGKSRHRADNERYLSRNPSPNHLSSH
jgi:hypothetical protein